MGIRFISLDSQSQKLVRWLIEHSLAEGGSTFELGARENRPAD